MAADDARAIDCLPIVPESERHICCASLITPGAEYPKDVPLAKLVEQQVERTPDAVAVTYDEQRLTSRS